MACVMVACFDVYLAVYLRCLSNPTKASSCDTRGENGYSYIISIFETNILNIALALALHPIYLANAALSSMPHVALLVRMVN